MISRGKGIVVHRDACKNVQDLHHKKENVSEINWSPNVSGEFLANIHVEVKSERGIIANLATIIARTGTSIEGIQVQERDAENSVNKMTLAVHDRVHLAQVMKKVRIVQSVEKVVRERN